MLAGLALEEGGGDYLVLWCNNKIYMEQLEMTTHLTELEVYPTDGAGNCPSANHPLSNFQVHTSILEL